jgi:uncharacterized membrane protein
VLRNHNVPEQGCWIKPAAEAAGTERCAMQDVAMVLFTIIFFAVAFLYVKACQKLR